MNVARIAGRLPGARPEPQGLASARAALAGARRARPGLAWLLGEARAARILAEAEESVRQEERRFTGA